ncbi:Nucleolar protein 9 [Exophiala dermatitidis]|uniref:Nucleolar protein 9 n=2 Tax=Exophiala dermatitidis TaxID=5970 RepID=H6C2F4_EXODN|nr:uncharacterized protein HMPREF1120_06735 [Exophiala dermatitidis NIH/UT8656]KAJ4508514.1 Nucleolar protein 9 [Exophiala dermatitidis]EHY58732.1 hypothetical protein HMPREF1120_06735 [Exophiala dermatitidis NIH/UT8656]KAJ4510430.1 Nucleolar protein 9 [Exophiala dermatitidis]KAJ4510636.1 Nucleolar protein 9 [Exophiala dermatitidis]KAJ4535038.1 Nucleolar protein 9 [Exophiala dermatitidis]
MPRERKRRGRREEARSNKRKGDEDFEPAAKRLKSDDHDHDAEIEEQPDDIAINGDAGDDYIGFNMDPPSGIQEPQDEDVFHGLLDPQEQEYYANVNNKIVANDFESSEDRAIFIEAVHRETEGKELKVASSQSCSRYLEKIIMLSTPDQLRKLFSKFCGHFTYLVRHRFGSHCCETLFLEAAKHVGKENRESKDEEPDLPSMEQLFLQAAEELEPNMGYLLTDRFASHTVRVLFLILSGEPLDDDSIKSMLASKKKEKLDAPSREESQPNKNMRNVPKSFRPALDKLIRSAISALDTTYLRALATHPTGNPVLQLLVRLELSNPGKNKQLEENSVFKKLLPDEDLEDDTESAKFISGLMYDPTGSHLVEIFVQRLAGKSFKKLYKNILKPRLSSMAKNDIAGFVAIRILERLGRDDLDEAKTLLLPEVPTLIARRRTGLIKTLVERCAVRGVDLQDLAHVLKAEYGEDPAQFVPKLLDFKAKDTSEQSQDEEKQDKPRSTVNKTDVHASLLAQAMLQAPKTDKIVQESLLAIDIDILLQMCQDQVASRVVQTALSPTPSNIQFRRQFVPRFYGHIAALAQDLSGSYVADALWAATEGLHFMKERLAKELASQESQIRLSPFGRNVWKNWAMDSYQRRPAEWRALAKGYDKEDAPTEATTDGHGKSAGGKKTVPEKKSAIQLARERHMQKTQQQASKHGKTPGSGANAVPTNA